MMLALEAWAKADDIIIGDTPKAKQRRKRLADLTPVGRLWKHSTLRDIDGIVDASTMENYFVFTIVLNPWDRMVSYYRWAREQSFDPPVVRAAAEHDFAEFIHHPDVWHPLQASPYRSYVQSSSGADHCNLHVRLEHLKEDIATLDDHLRFLSDVGYVNASARYQDYRTNHTNDLRDLVARIRADDIARFEYPFKRLLHKAKTQLSCPTRRNRRAAPACPLGRRFHPINALKL